MIWPMLEKAPASAQKINKLTFKVKDKENNKVLIDQAIKMLQAEDERKKIVENKSTIFISAIGIITSILIGATSALIKNSEYNAYTFLIILTLFILSIYMLKSV